MTGYRSKFFRHDCLCQGCYVQKLPSWDDLIEAFPRSIRPTDIDGMVEINGHILVLEEKCFGKGPDEGQRRALKVLAEGPKTTVVFFRPAVEGQDDPLEVLVYPNPQGWRQVTRAQFKHWLNAWTVRAERKAS